MTTGNKDIDTIVSEGTPLTLMSGFEIVVERLRTRQLMSLLKILTRGAGSVLGELRFSSDMDPQEFTGNLIGAVLLSIPEAEDETVEFINRMVSPAGLKEGRLTKDEILSNDDLEQELRSQLSNPELEDLLTIMEQVITNEAPHILALGKRLAALLKVQTLSTTAKQSSSSKSVKKA